MIKVLTLVFCVGVAVTAHAQLGNVLEKAKNKAKNKVERRIDQKTDKAIDKTIDDAENAVKNAGKNTNDADSSANVSTTVDGKVKAEPASFKSYTKFDFVPGEKLIASEDFSQDGIGDFPARWNTNGSGEVVTTNKGAGRYLMTQKESVFYPDWISNLPDNFTAEFDILCTDNFSYYSGELVIGFTTSANVGSSFFDFNKTRGGRINGGGGFEVGFHPENAGGALGTTSFYSSDKGSEFLNNTSNQEGYMVPQKPYAHISVWRQKTRVRVYIDDKKVWDLPRGLADGLNLNSVYFRNNGASGDNDALYLTNFKLAIGFPDTRNKLITEGKFVSHGILFDTNSDKIKPESYGAIKEIAAVLKENSDVKVLIVGHTDSDGGDASNLELSRKRAAAVKATLADEFSIDTARLTADGKGESQPIDNNATALGKANNRRVEFIKQ